jgi:2-ketoarginine methyltransferase
MSTPPLLEARIIEALQPLRQHAVAACIHHLFESKLFERLHQARTLTELAGEEFDAAKLHAFLRFLRNEAFVDEVSGRWELSDKGHELELVRGWYTMFVGGYGSTFLQLGRTSSAGSTRFP